MKTLLALVLIACASTTALADEKFVVISGVSSDDNFDHRGIAIESGVAVGEGRIALRGLLSVGRSRDRESRFVTDPMTGETLSMYTTGIFETLRIGFEARARPKIVRLFGGIDVGYEADHRTYAHMTEYAGALVTVPRIGLEVGHRVRVRAAFEVPLLEKFDGDGPTAGTGISLGVGFAL